jgi:hypothetical protein
MLIYIDSRDLMIFPRGLGEEKKSDTYLKWN